VGAAAAAALLVAASGAYIIANRADEQRTLTGHTDSVIAISWSPDGDWLASGGNDDSLRVWRLEGAELFRTFIGNAPVSAVSWSSDGTWLASGNTNGRYTVRRTPTGTPYNSNFPTRKLKVAGLAWAPIGNSFVYVTEDRTATLLAVSDPDDNGYVALDGVATGFLGQHHSNVTAVAWSADGTTMVSADDTGNVWPWKTEPATAPLPSILLTGFRRSSPTIAMAVSPDGSRLATVGEDGAAHIWEVGTSLASSALADSRDPLQSLDGGPVTSVSWSPNGRYVATGHGDGTARVWDAQTWQETKTFTGQAAVSALAWAPDSKHLAIGGVDGTLRVIVAAAAAAVVPQSGGEPEPSPDANEDLNSHGPVQNLAQCALGSWDVVRSEELNANNEWVPMPSSVPQSVHFGPDGIVSLFILETGSDGDYTVSGDQVTISNVPRYPGAVVTWTVTSCDDDTLVYTIGGDHRTTLQRP
jgi:hypothetical protein